MPILGTLHKIALARPRAPALVPVRAPRREGLEGLPLEKLEGLARERGTVVVYQVNGSRVEWSPPAARLRGPTEKMPNASVAEFGHVNVQARLASRGTQSTYLVEDSAKFLRVPVISPFFPHDVADMGNRMLALPDSHEVQAFELNTGRVGGAGRHRDPPAPATLRPAGPGRRARGHGARLRQERKVFPGSFPGRDESLVKSLG